MINCSRCNMASNLVKCLDCSLVFCSLAKKSSATCLSHHLKTLKHKKIEIGRSMECKHCKESDVFTLGYHDENIDKISCLMCKNKENVSENNVNVVWKPLIFNESVSNWVFDDRTLNKQSVNKALFGDFFSNRLVKLVSKAFALTKPSFTKIKFTPNEYVTFFTVLLQEEFKFEVKMKEKMTQTNVHVDWYETDEEIKKCSFELNQNKNHLKIKAGDEVHLSSPEFIAKGRISDDLDLHAVDVEIFFIKGVPPDIVDEIVFPPGSVSFSRMACALERFERSCSASLFNFILTGENDGNTDHIITNDILVSTTTCDDHKHVLYPPNVPRLNYSQIVALKAALNQSLTLIQGPPGTGKTSTSATLVYNLVTKKMGKVLVVASSNAAVNNLVKQMLKANINVVHILANSRQKDNFGSHTLHQMIKARMKKELKKLKKKRSGSGCSGIQIDESYLKSIIESLRSEYENDILTSADVVACTCIISGEMILRKIEFQNVLIDEAVQCIEPATVIPLTYGCKRLILVGDHKQLGPVILNQFAKRGGLNMSMFERLIKLGVEPYTLSVQYRMHPLIAQWPNNTFYSGKIMDGLTIAGRSSVLKLTTFFHVSKGLEFPGKGGKSFLNKEEIENILDMVHLLINKGVDPQNIGIITLYEAQRVAIKREIASHYLFKNLKFDIFNVDGFQGQEKDYIIVSLVRSNDDQKIGFLDDKRRLNVALTRARRGLFIFGNPHTFLNNKMWLSLIEFYQDKALIFEGCVFTPKKCVGIAKKAKNEVKAIKSAEKNEDKKDCFSFKEFEEFL